ncbi:MAG: hypothetical protein JXR91_10320 [Deltaproteobacteria bacterium]|nr:hypothetical protein [Deltaproteobacteria bacterium]
MEICLTCGTIKKSSDTQCSVCETPYEENTADVSPPGDDLCIARFNGHFECRSCGHGVALNGLDKDGNILCGKCGIEQAFNWDNWDSILTHAHNTADFAGWNKPQANSPLWKGLAEEMGEDTAEMFKRIGDSRSILSLSDGAFRGLSYEVEASPGYPICEQCKKPLTIKIEKSSLKTACSECSLAATYEIPSNRKAYSPLEGIISFENRTDALEVKQESSKGGAALAITCPQCGGALENIKAGTITKCPYCYTSCHIPSRIFQKTTGKVNKEAPWWLVFRGPSKARSKSNSRVEIIKHKKALEKQKMLEDMEQAEKEEAYRRKANNRIILIVALIFIVTLTAAFVLNR